MLCFYYSASLNEIKTKINYFSHTVAELSSSGDQYHCYSFNFKPLIERRKQHAVIYLCYIINSLKCQDRHLINYINLYVSKVNSQYQYRVELTKIVVDFIDCVKNKMSNRNICSVDGCESRMTNQISFFRWPKDEGRCQAWKNAFGFIGSHRYADNTPMQYYNRFRICILHFNDDSFTNSSKTRIHSYAIPSIGVPTQKDDAYFPKASVDAIVQIEPFEVNEPKQPLLKVAGTQTSIKLSADKWVIQWEKERDGI